MLEYPCDNGGLVLVCLPSGSTDGTTSPSQCMTQPPGSLSCLLYFLCMSVIPIIIPLFKIQRLFNLLVSSPILVSFRLVAT